MNNIYELTVLLSDEKDIKPVQEYITSLEGNITEYKKWGERTLSYPVKKQTKAYYVSFKFSMAAKNVMELKKKLNYDEQLMRYLLLKADDSKNQKS